MWLYELYFEPFLDGSLEGKIIGLLVWAITLFVAGLILYGGYYLVDSVGAQEYTDRGVIIDKSYSPAYTTTSMIMVGKTYIPQTIHHPESWDLKIKVNKDYDTISVSRSYYEKSKINQTVWVKYSRGRFSKGIYIKEIR